MPLVASMFGGEWDQAGPGIELIRIQRNQVLKHLPRPVSMASDREAYALTIVGDSMWPRFRPGRRVLVSPGSPVAIGDDVLIRLPAAGAEEPGQGIKAMVKELARRAGSHVQLRQFNPDIVFEVPASQIVAIHKVVGELI